MKITILGSGTSTGVPEYKCECETCLDARRPGSRNHRTRPSCHVEVNGAWLQFDTGPNFLDQIDRNGVDQIDAVIYTHCHSDHISGTNDLVMPCRKQEMDMEIFGPEETMRVLRRNFDYMFSKESFKGGGLAHLIPNAISARFTVCGVDVLPVPVTHGAVDTFGYRIGPFGYLPDVKQISGESLELLQGIEVLVMDGLSFNPRHPTHLSVGETVEISNALEPRETYLTHIMHRLDDRFFREQCVQQGVDLPETIGLAYDGQVIDC